MKQCILIAGPNGAGKTTFAHEFLPNEAQIINFLNADMIAYGLSPFAPEKAALMASKLLIRRIDECCNNGDSFGLETTLSGKLHLNRINWLHKNGYFVILHFLKLKSVKLAIERVQYRIRHGGHYIPDDVIIRRFKRGLYNLPLYQKVVDKWKIWDTSQGKPELINES